MSVVGLHALVVSSFVPVLSCCSYVPISCSPSSWLLPCIDFIFRRPRRASTSVGVAVALFDAFLVLVVVVVAVIIVVVVLVTAGFMFSQFSLAVV